MHVNAIAQAAEDDELFLCLVGIVSHLLTHVLPASICQRGYFEIQLHRGWCGESAYFTIKLLFLLLLV